MSVKLDKFNAGALKLSRTDWICLAVIALGAFLFLYGANYYDSTVGWTGVVLFFGGILAWFALYVYCTLLKWKSKRAQKA